MNQMTPNNIPQGYKATALGIIPQEWEVKKLGEVGKLLSGLTYTPSNIQSDGILVLRSSNIQNGVLAFDDNVYVNVSSYTPVKAGDILICVRNGSQNLIGKTALITQEAEGCAFGAFMAVFRSSISKYVFYLLGTELYRKYIYRNLGATINSINGSDLKKFRFPFPPLAEQRKIAEVLGVWDEAIEKQARLIEKLALRKRGLMQRLLSAKLRLPGFSEPWKKVKLGEIGKFDKGYGVPKESIRNTGNKAITYGEIYTKHDFVIKKFTSYIDDETAVVSKKITQGAILFTGSGETLEDIGKCVAFIDNDIAYAGGDIIIFNPSIEINSLVLSYCLNSAPVNAQKATYGQGHSVVHIYQKDLAKLQVTIPSFPEQNAIAEVLTAADREIELAKEKLDRLRRQKRGLMQQLLTGKKRIKF